MSIPSSQSTLTIKIDSDLATAYRDAYRRALSSRVEIKQTLDEFIAGFVEDRLTEEIAFFEKEIVGNRR